MSSTYERIWLNACGSAAAPARLWNCAPDTPDRKASNDWNGAAAGPAGWACAGDHTPAPTARPTAAIRATLARLPNLYMTTPHLGRVEEWWASRPSETRDPEQRRTALHTAALRTAAGGRYWLPCAIGYPS